jgi:predicted ester cyclase
VVRRHRRHDHGQRQRRRLFAGVVAAFPDAHITINDIFGQGDQVVVRVVVSGTQEGPILGIPQAPS